MALPPRIAIALIVATAFLLRGSFAAEPEGEASAWFEQLDFPNVKGCPYVRVQADNPDRGSGGQPETLFRDGFLLSDQKGKFTVFFGDEVSRPDGPRLGRPLCVETFSKSAPQNNARYHQLDLRAEAAKGIEALKQSKDVGGSYSFERYLDPRAAAFVLARNCRQAGLGAEADQLLVEAEKLSPPPQFQSSPSGSFLTRLQEHLGVVLITRAMLDFQDPASRFESASGKEKAMKSRAELLAEFRALSRVFPAETSLAPLSEIVATLERMVREDEAHRPKPLDQMTGDEQVGEWVFRLRDQPGWVVSRPGSCEIFPFGHLLRGALKHPLPKYPADRLAEAGLAAVPRLIEALDNQEFTRAIDSGPLLGGFPKVLTIGECARQTLAYISGKAFDVSLESNDAKGRDDARQQTKDMIQKWWAAVQKESEAAVQEEEVRTGDWDSMGLARKLWEISPDRASAAIVIGIQHADTELVRNSLISMLNSGQDKVSTAFLNQKMVDGSWPRKSRILAAEALYWRGDDRAWPVLIAEWKNGTSGSGDSILEGRRDSQQLADFLLTSGKPEAVKCITESLPKCPASIKIPTINSISFRRISTGPRRDLSKGQAEISDALIDRMLFTFLDDNDRYAEFSVSSSDFAVREPRVCEMAAWKLSQRWPEKYPFKWMKSPDAMDRQIAAVKAAWRESKE